MSSIVFPRQEDRLTEQRFNEILTDIVTRLEGRVSEAYVFGSAGTERMTTASDVDLILISEAAAPIKFSERALAFVDLMDLFPRLDILVYTKAELNRQLEDSRLGFWKSARESMRRIV